MEKECFFLQKIYVAANLYALFFSHFQLNKDLGSGYSCIKVKKLSNLIVFSTKKKIKDETNVKVVLMKE